MQEDITTIKLRKSEDKALREIKKYPRETYNETILGLIRDVQESREIDAFIQKAQESNMKELWGEGKYSGWENA